MNNIEVKLNSNISFGNHLPFTLIAGPCVLESKQHALDISGYLKELTSKLNINFVYKTSFDKANRTDLTNLRGIGLNKSIEIFKDLKQEIGCPILTDVHSPEQCKMLDGVVDIIQIPAFLCRQTDLLVSAASTGLVINIKKGQFLAPWDMENVINKVVKSGNSNVLVTERGVTFGYNNLVNDMKSLPILKSMGYPVVFDATHSVQQPGGQGTSSGGQRQFVEPLSKAAIAIGVAAIFIETHQDPDNAPSDGPNMVKLNDLEKMLIKFIKLDEISKKLDLNEF
ncbi:3-deoxy-8-phosphooctulonate synthase [Alphaproteobacteria bacterium]|nr:3-deoxy-8-phosphooctulonate synthase [Alphaproteobacteria bacterium]